MTSRSKGLMVCVALSWPLLAQGGFSGPGRYEITNVKSGKVLDLDRNDRTTVIQFAGRGTDNQTWFVQPAQNGYFFLRNGMNGYAMDAGYAGNSAFVVGTPFNGGDSQQWRFDQGKDGNALIVSRLGRTLDIPDGTGRDGARVQVYDPNGDSNQRFIFRRVNGRGAWDERREARVVNCSSNHGERVYCDADTHGGVQLMRQISGSACRQGSTWGFDRRGIWVDRGCRADFSVGR